MKRLYAFTITLLLAVVGYAQTFPKEAVLTFIAPAAVLTYPRPTEAQSPVKTQPEAKEPLPSPEIDPVKPTSTPKSVPKKKVVITEQNVYEAMDIMDTPESQGRCDAYNPRDVDGKEKFGRFQYDMDTWNEFSRRSGITGDPRNCKDAHAMTRWALLNGLGYRWGTWKLVVEQLGK